jgi:lipopolysaccharide transport system ATP-binding protein
MNKVIETYIATNKVRSFSLIEKESNGFIVHSIRASNNRIDGNFDIENDLEIIIEVSSSQEQELININLFFNTPDGALIFATCSSVEKLEKGKTNFLCVIPARTLNDNMYLIDLMVVSRGATVLHDIKGVLTLQGTEDKRIGGWLGKFPGLIRPQYFKWSKIDTDE